MDMSALTINNPIVQIKAANIFKFCKNVFYFTDKGFKIEVAKVKKKYWLFGKKTYLAILKK